MVAVYGTGRASAQNQQQNTEGSTESIAFQAAHNQASAQLRVKLLEDFATKYPNSDFLPQVYRDAFMTYFSPLGDYPKTVEYVDKFLVFQAKIDSSDRLEALVTRAKAVPDLLNMRSLYGPSGSDWRTINTA